jgi:uncharacterized Zn-binding protein involved in type VI secretion
MSLKIITVGDKTDHGGTVISGSPNHDIRGRAIARLGDKVNCPLPYPIPLHTTQLCKAPISRNVLIV